MEYFNERDINHILEKYKTYIVTLKTDTFNQYKEIISDYMVNIVLDRIEAGNYEAIFHDININKFRKIRKSLIVRSALNKLLSMFIDEGKISKGFEFNFSIEQRDKSNCEFLSLKELKYIFNGAEYKSYEEETISRAICALSCFCLFEQKHIKSLKFKDVLFEQELIRNLRTDGLEEETAHLKKWIKMNDVTLKWMKIYANEFRKKLEVDYDEFFIYESKPLNDVNGVNRFLDVYKRAANKDNVKNVNIQLLNSTSMYYWLISSHGNSLSDILQIVEINNAQWQKAHKHYLIDFDSQLNSKGYAVIEDLEVIETRSSIRESIISDYDRIMEENETVEDGTSTFDIVFPYSEESDISMNDLLEFDSLSKKNCESSLVSIDRLVRDTKISRELKKYYQGKCQVCERQLRSANGTFISEAHHIKPYNNIHRGDDSYKNLIVLCPNCHSQFDQLYYAINPENLKIHSLYDDDMYHLKDLYILSGHTLGSEHLEYIYSIFLNRKEKI